MGTQKKALNQIHFFTLQRFQLYKKKISKKFMGLNTSRA
jgi:hypothetical protein